MCVAGTMCMLVVWLEMATVKTAIAENCVSRPRERHFDRRQTHHTSATKPCQEKKRMAIMDYLLKADFASMLRLRKIFSDTCAMNGVQVNSAQTTAVLNGFISQASAAGLLVSVEKPTEGAKK